MSLNHDPKKTPPARKSPGSPGGTTQSGRKAGEGVEIDVLVSEFEHKGEGFMSFDTEGILCQNMYSVAGNTRKPRTILMLTGAVVRMAAAKLSSVETSSVTPIV